MKMKKMFALTLGATMAMGTAMPVMASDPTVTAPIYSFEKIDVVVPTTYKVAFNPEGLTVKTDDSTGTSTDQILSKNYGILNKSNKDMVSHVEWHMRGFRIEGIKSGCEPVPDLVWVEKEELENRYALPVAFHAFLQIL